MTPHEWLPIRIAEYFEYPSWNRLNLLIETYYETLEEKPRQREPTGLKVDEEA